MKKIILTISLILLSLLQPHLAQGNTCFDYFSVLEESSTSISIVQRSLTESQAYELLLALESVPEEQRMKLYRALAEVDVIELAERLRAGESLPEMADFVENVQGADQFLYDMIAVGEAFPGLFSEPRVDELLLKTLRSIRAIEANEGLMRGELLAAITVGSRLKLTLRQTVANLIRQGDLEYQGQRFGQTRWQFFWYRFRRFFHPTF